MVMYNVFGPGFVQTITLEMLQSGLQQFSSPVPSGSNTGRQLVLTEMTPAPMYSNLLPDCVYDHPTLCQEWGWGAFLGLVVSLKQGSCLPMSQKSQDHRWYQLCLS